jgi:DNA-binding beta-propeller fold protein YncE
VRRPFAFVLLLAACIGGDKTPPPPTRTASSVPASSTGAQPLLLRVPVGGGVPHVVAYPDLESTVWRGSESAPSLQRVLAFDADAGMIAAVDTRDRPAWIDLRAGTVIEPARSVVHGVKSIDGSTAYGVGADGSVVRFTPSGSWLFKPPGAAHVVFPQSGGSLLILGGQGSSTKVWRIRPPAPKVLDSLTVPDATGGAGAPLGDAVYLAVPTHALVALRTRTLGVGPKISFDHAISSIATTPSGDRFYVVNDSENTVHVVDRFQDRIVREVALPGRPRDLRMDPFGRYLLVRSATRDSVWVVAVGTDRVIGNVRSEWRGDLPFVAPDGAIAVTAGRDVAFVDGVTRRELHRAVDGASEFWYPFMWDGLRPRAAAVEAPVQFPTDTDSLTRPRPTPVDTTTIAKPAPLDSARIGFTVSFAVLLDHAKAQDLAAKIVVNGQSARIVTSLQNGTSVYRVVLGPYSTRDEAERAGRASGQSYYIYAGSP